MTGTRITKITSTGLKITNANQNPVLVTASGGIVTNDAYAIFDDTSTPGQITNHGLLDSKSSSGTGVEEMAAGSKLTNSGTITGGSGVYIYGGQAIVTNTGTIIGLASNGDGIALAAGGKITNGAAKSFIAGGNDGVLIEAGGGHIENYGAISGRAADGIKITSGNGTIANTGAASSITGALYGVLINAGGSITNEGTISGQTGAGLYIGGAGNVTNSGTASLITGGSYGVFIGAGHATLSNDGSITATTNSGIGIVLNAGGTLQNGTANATASTIHGGLDGVLVRTGTTTITNDGTITAGDGIGVHIDSTTGKPSVTNGTAAQIAGNTYGISFGGDGVVYNDGTISAVSGAGIYIAGSGTITNGETSQPGAVVSGGRYGIYANHTGNITNFGSISGTNSSGIGVDLKSGGTLQNSSGASITGGSGGIIVEGASSNITNNGTITAANLYGILIQTDSATITNAKGALISGIAGIALDNAGTLTNAGTITGTGGNAVVFNGTHDTLVVDPGAVFNGKANGGGTSNKLEFAAGNGTTRGLGTKFTDFGTITFDSGATWSLAGANTAARLLDNGTIKLAANASLDVTSTVIPASTGLFQLASNATLELAADTGAQNKISFLASAELIIDKASQFGNQPGTPTCTGPEIENFAAGDMIDLDNIRAAGAALTYDSATGLLQITSDAAPTATLFFDQSTLGAGSFHLGTDSNGHVVITHS